jgi:dynein heavy chain
MKAFYEMIDRDGKMMHESMNETSKLFDVDDSSDDWKNYLQYVDSLVVEGFSKTITTSLKYIADNMTTEFLEENELSTLLETRLELANDQLQFTPSLDDGK